MRRSNWILGAVAASLTTTVVSLTTVVNAVGAATTAKSEYQASLKAAASENVHYVSKATEEGISLEVVGDTGQDSGSEVLAVRSGSTTENLSVVLIGSTGYLRGNAPALEKILGLTTEQSATYKNEWLSFPTSNATLAELVNGLRDSDVATELEMTGPYVLGAGKEIGGHSTDAITGTQATSSGGTVPIVLYVEATGTPRPVEEVTNPKGKNNKISGTVTFSNWGEQTHQSAPTKSVPLLPLLPAS